MNSDRTKQAVHLALYYFANPYNRQEKFFKKEGVTHESCNVWNKSMPGLRRGRRNFKRERNPISVYGILGAIIGANIAIKVNVKILKKAFGIFLAIIVIHEIYTSIKLYKKEKVRDNNNE